MTKNMFNNIAVLIDADNASYRSIPTVLNKISTYGRITAKRVYGNWTKEGLKLWKGVVENLALNPQHQFDHVKGKNATDIALVIDAMKLLHSNRYDAFVIVSSDSDFTRLCIELKETGVCVIGVGIDNTSNAFKRSCDEFISVDKLMNSFSSQTDVDELPAEQTEQSESIQSVNASEKSAVVTIDESIAKTAHNVEENKTTNGSVDNEDEKSNTNKSIESEDEEPFYNTGIDEAELHSLLRLAAETEKWQDDDGFVNAAGVGDFIKRTHPDFDITNFGFKKLPAFIEAHSELYETKTYQGKGTVMVRAYKCK